MLRMKSRLTILAAALALGTAAAKASPIPDYPFVHVSGSSSRVELPDIATLDFELVAADADPAAAFAVLQARAGEIRDLMQQLGMDLDADLGFRGTRQSIRKDEKSATGGPVYELRCDVHIKVRDVANWQKLAGGLFGKPNLDSFSSTFDNSEMDRITDEMVTEALADARRRAEVIAAASGRRLGQVTGATPDSLARLGTSMGLERAEFRAERRRNNTGAGDLDREQLMMIQSLKLRQAVDVVFRLENPARTGTAKRP